MALLAALAILVPVAPAAARTITLTAEDCDRIAVIAGHAPRMSWACCQLAPGVFDTNHQLQTGYRRDVSVLLRFPLDTIPKGQRITKAELTVTAAFVDGFAKLPVKRLLADWGPGVCHQYRATVPQKVEWAQPGGRGDATDRANKESAVFHVKAVGVHTVDVTEDVELWYTGAVMNRGWIISQEDGGAVYFPAPYSPNAGTGKLWKLQITFEPQ